jgi:glucan phosphoethanolaminetransferase (alkaline phosphatase superfamily)
MKSRLVITSFILTIVSAFVYVSFFVVYSIDHKTGMIIDSGIQLVNSLFLGLHFFKWMLVMGFLTSIVSLIRIKKYELEGKKMALVSLIISGILLLIGWIFSLIKG